jgi:predicted RNase H-like HicB family nuclease
VTGEDVERFLATLRYIVLDTEDDGRFIAEVPSMPGMMAYGKDQDEAIAAVKALAESVSPGYQYAVSYGSFEFDAGPSISRLPRNTLRVL